MKTCRNSYIVKNILLYTTRDRHTTSSVVTQCFVVHRSFLSDGEQNHREVAARRSEATNTHIRPGKIDSGETFTVARSYSQDEVKSRRYRETRKKCGETHIPASRKGDLLMDAPNVASWRELCMRADDRDKWRTEDKSESTACTTNWSDNI